MHLQSHAKKKHKGTWLCAVTTRSAKYLTKQTTPTPAGRNFTLWPKSLGPLCFHPAAALLFGTFCTCFIYYSGYSCPKILQSTKCTIAIPLPSHCHPIAITLPSSLSGLATRSNLPRVRSNFSVASPRCDSKSSMASDFSAKNTICLVKRHVKTPRKSEEKTPTDQHKHSEIFKILTCFVYD